MTITPEKLREIAENVLVMDASREDASVALRQSADEIERLRAINAQQTCVPPEYADYWARKP